MSNKLLIQHQSTYEPKIPEIDTLIIFVVK